MTVVSVSVSVVELLQATQLCTNRLVARSAFRLSLMSQLSAARLRPHCHRRSNDDPSDQQSLPDDLGALPREHLEQSKQHQLSLSLSVHPPPQPKETPHKSFLSRHPPQSLSQKCRKPTHHQPPPPPTPAPSYPGTPLPQAIPQPPFRRAAAPMPRRHPQGPTRAAPRQKTRTPPPGA